MYYYNGAQRYEQFLQVGRLCRALIFLGSALCLPSTSMSLVFMVIKIFFCLHPSLYLLVSWAWWDWPLTRLTNHRPSVLWHCWLGHLTRKIVSEMTYNVSSGTLNPTIPSTASLSMFLKRECAISKGILSRFICYRRMSNERMNCLVL